MTSMVVVSLTHDIVIVCSGKKAIKWFLLYEAVYLELPHVYSDKFCHNIFLSFIVVLVICLCFT